MCYWSSLPTCAPSPPPTGPLSSKRSCPLPARPPPCLALRQKPLGGLWVSLVFSLECLFYALDASQVLLLCHPLEELPLPLAQIAAWPRDGPPLPAGSSLSRSVLQPWPPFQRATPTSGSSDESWRNSSLIALKMKSSPPNKSLRPFMSWPPLSSGPSPLVLSSFIPATRDWARALSPLGLMPGNLQGLPYQNLKWVFPLSSCPHISNPVYIFGLLIQFPLQKIFLNSNGKASPMMSRESETCFFMLV